MSSHSELEHGHMVGKQPPGEYPSSPIRPIRWDYTNKRPVLDQILLPRGFVGDLDPSDRAIKPDLIRQALELIAPNKEDEASCHEGIVVAIWFIRYVIRFHSHLGRGATVAQKRNLAQLKNALNKAINSFAKLPPPLRMALFPVESEVEKFEKLGWKGRQTGRWPKDWPYPPDRAFSIELNNLVERIANIASSTSKLDLGKNISALRAYGLMGKFGRTPPTMTVGGPYYLLASILHKAATGNPKANLDRQCRALLREREPNRGASRRGG